MNKTIYLTILGLFILTFSNAQNKPKELQDSIQFKYDKIEKANENLNFNQVLENADELIHFYNKKKLNPDTYLLKTHVFMGAILSKRSKLNLAAKHLNKALALSKQIGLKKDLVLVTIHRFLCIIYSSKGKLNTAFKHINSAINLYKDLNLTNNELLAKLHLTQGAIYFQTKDYDNALISFEACLALEEERLGKDNPNLYYLFNNLGSIAYKMKDYDAAITYFKKSNSSILKLLGNNSKLLKNGHNNLGIVYTDQNNYSKAIDHLNRAIKLSKNNPIGTINPISSLANVYIKIQDYDQAILLHTKALDLKTKYFGANSLNVISSLKNLSHCYKFKKEYNKAIVFAKKTLKTLIHSKSNDHKFHDQISNQYIDIGRIYESLQDWDTARGFYDKALATELKGNYKQKLNTKLHHERMANISLGFINTAIELNIEEDFNKHFHFVEQLLGYTLDHPINFSKVDKEPLFFNFLNAKIRFFKWEFKNTSNPSYKDSLTLIHNSRITYSDYRQDKLFRNNDRTFIVSSNFNNYEDALSFAYEEKNTKIAFQLSEKVKSGVLLQGIKNSNLNLSSLLPDSLTHILSKYETKIAELEKLKFNKKVSKENELTLITLNEQKDSLTAHIKINHPEYYQLKNSHKIVDIRNIQQSLKNEQAILEYFVGESNIYLFLITKTNFKTIRIKNDFPLDEWVQSMREGIYGYWNHPFASDQEMIKANKNYLEHAYLLYKKLWAPIAKDLPKRVTIVPDGSLNFIPFDALLTQQINATSYLLKQHQISYAHSATLLKYLWSRKTKNRRANMMALAPAFKNSKSTFRTLEAKRSGLSNLEHNIPEAQHIANQLDGYAVIGNRATKEQFIKNAHKYSILHLSTHAKANDEMGDFSYIAFQQQDSITPENDRMFVRELYNMKLNADMVVLSACETGLGELKKGEGVISLSSGFLYAGASSTITSLWSVDDAQTARLMSLFYDNLKEGMPKDEALHQAKLTYLEQEDKIAPYFWAGFIPSGDMRPIYALQSKAGFWGITFLLIALGGSIMYYHKKSA